MKKKANIDVEKVVPAVILLIIGIIVVFQIIANTATDLTVAAGNVSSSGLPLANLFASDGVILLVFMAGIMLAIIFAALKFGKGKGK